MLRRSSVCLGDLHSIDDAWRFGQRGSFGRSQSRPILATFCVGSLSLLTACGLAWLGWRGEPAAIPPVELQIAPSVSIEMSRPAAFPSWVEVPHLTGPLSLEEDPEGSQSAIGTRSFLDANPADTVEEPVFLPPRANPRRPLIGLAPLDAGRLTRELLPGWDEHTDRSAPIVAVSLPPPVVIALAPDMAQLLRDRAEPTMQTALGDPTPAQVVTSASVLGTGRIEATDRPAAIGTAVLRPNPVATLGPEPVQQVRGSDRSTVRTIDADAGLSPILSREPARRARSPTPQRPSMGAPRALQPDRDTERTASITGPPKPVHHRIDAEAVSRTSLSRARTEFPAVPAASPPWTLPLAIAPSN